jgi:hypothetical protein
MQFRPGRWAGSCVSKILSQPLILYSPNVLANRYKEAEGVDRWERDMIIPDTQCIKEWNEGVELGRSPGSKVDYVPVVSPGFSVSAAHSSPLEMRPDITLGFVSSSSLP